MLSFLAGIAGAGDAVVPVGDAFASVAMTGFVTAGPVSAMTLAKPTAFAGAASVAGVTDGLAAIGSVNNVAFASAATTGWEMAAATVTASATGSAALASAMLFITAANPFLPIASPLFTCTVLCSAVWRGFMWR